MSQFGQEPVQEEKGHISQQKQNQQHNAAQLPEFLRHRQTPARHGVILSLEGTESPARLEEALAPLLAPDASVVTMSISSTRMAAESYGYMGPVKAALDSTVVFLAKSLSASLSPDIRVNAVGAAPLKTSASAGIPGYVDAYLFAEKATMRHRALETREAADTALFLLSPRASGINAQTLVVDAGMGANFFDHSILHPEP